MFQHLSKINSTRQIHFETPAQLFPTKHHPHSLSPKSLRLQREQRRFTGWRHESSANSPPLPNLGLIIEAVETRWPG